MKNAHIIVLLIALIACKQKEKKTPLKPSIPLSHCERESIQTRKEAENELICYLLPVSFGNVKPRYEYELMSLLSQKNIQYRLYPIGCDVSVEKDCYKHTMDSLVVVKYGKSIREIHKEADSLFTLNNSKNVLSYWTVDKRPTFKSSNKAIIDDLFIDHLNSNLDDSSKYYFISNTVGTSYCVIRYTINKKGEASNCIITEENFLYGETDEVKIRLRKQIISEVNHMKIWNAGLLGDKKVSVREIRGVAIKWN